MGAKKQTHRNGDSFLQKQIEFGKLKKGSILSVNQQLTIYENTKNVFFQ